MSDIEEYREGEEEFQEQVYREFVYQGSPTIREIFLIERMLRDEARELIAEQNAILDPEELKTHRIRLYHTQARIAYWEQIRKGKPEFDKLYHQATEQVGLDAKQSEESPE